MLLPLFYFLAELYGEIQPKNKCQIRSEIMNDALSAQLQQTNTFARQHQNVDYFHIQTHKFPFGYIFIFLFIYILFPGSSGRIWGCYPQCSSLLVESRAATPSAALFW